MRPSNKSRSRNKPGGNGSHGGQRRSSMGNIINRVFESAGPDGKVRGTPQQIIDKYQALARDAQVAGDRVAAESYLQHAEHYSRLLGEAQRQQQESRFGNNPSEREEPRGGQGGDEGGYEPQRRQSQFPQPVASGLTTIDTDDDDFSGPIETPEGRRSRRDEPAPIVDLAVPNGNGDAARPASPQPGPEPIAEPAAAPETAESQPEAKAEEEPAPKPKRTRRRRTTSAEASNPEAPPDIEEKPVSE